MMLKQQLFQIELEYISNYNYKKEIFLYFTFPEYIKYWFMFQIYFIYLMRKTDKNKEMKLINNNKIPEE